MERFYSAWAKHSTQCDGCSAKFNVFRRKKPCFSCKNYFCQVCIMRQPDKKMCCKKCQILTATPLDKNELLNLKSRDLVNYLTSRQISTSGCVEKEDLVNLLIRVVNNSGSSSALLGSSPSGYSNSPGKDSVSSDQPGAKRKPPQDSDNLFNEDGIRIKGTNLPESEGSCSSSDHSIGSDAGNDGDWVVGEGPAAESSESAEPTDASQARNQIQDTVLFQNPASDVARSGETENFKKERSKPLKLSDISSSADLDSLSVKDLKELLMTNRTDFKGCIERGELVDKAQRLWSDYTLSRKDLEKLSLEELCKICMDAPIECVLLECGHMATCMACGKVLSECPVCRQFVVRCVRTFKV